MIFLSTNDILCDSKYSRIALRKMDFNNLNTNSFVYVDKIFHEFELQNLENYLIMLKEKNVKGIIFSDLSVLNIAKKLTIENKLIYNPNTLITNHEDFNFYAEENILGAFISPFIPLDELKEIIAKKKMKVFYIGYGHLNLMYSKRNLLSTYHGYINEDIDVKNKVDFCLKEELRDDLYPIIESENGTYIYTAKPFSILPYIHELDIDYLIIDETFENVMGEFEKNYKDGTDFAYATSGFLNKKTIYRVK